MNIPRTIVLVLLLVTASKVCNRLTEISMAVSAFIVSPARPSHSHHRAIERPSSPTTTSTPMIPTFSSVTVLVHQRHKPFQIHVHNDYNDNNSNKKNNDVDPSTFNLYDPTSQELLTKARRLRQEISDIELSKLRAQNEKDVQMQARLTAEETVRLQKEQELLRYSAIVPILKDMGEEVMERVEFPPRLKGGKSCIVSIQAQLPLALILSEDVATPGLIYVDSLSPDGNGFQAGIQQGDVLRAVSACQVTMESPTWQLLAGGIGRPKTKRFMYAVDGRPLEEVLDAVGSNRMDGLGRDVWMVLERMQ